MSSGELALPGRPGLTADALLAGPRGRSLCVNLLDDRLSAVRRRVPRAWLDALRAVRTGDARRGARLLGECAGIAGLPGTPLDGSALMVGLQAAVDFASYWQEPDAEDQGFAADAAREALRPVAEAAAAAAAGIPGVAWWTEPADRSGQRCTQFLGRHPRPEPLLAGAAESLETWLAGTRENERSAPEQPGDPAASGSGPWWSSPARSRLPVTTRRLPGLGAAGLALTEDGLGWQLARCWPVTPHDSARVCEIHGPGQWAELVNRYPLDVSRSRGRDWRRATGQSGPWLIPDYAAAAADWDAIHVSVAGYLTTAGIPIPAGAGGRTMLAGWDPDATWWLADILSPAGPPQDWRRDQAPVTWARTR